MVSTQGTMIQVSEERLWHCGTQACCGKSGWLARNRFVEHIEQVKRLHVCGCCGATFTKKYNMTRHNDPNHKCTQDPVQDAQAKKARADKYLEEIRACYCPTKFQSLLDEFDCIAQA